jgi:dynein heavy chain
MPLVEKLFNHYLEPIVAYTRKYCPEPVATVDNNLCQSMHRLLDCFLVPYIDTELKKVLPEEVEDLE